MIILFHFPDYQEVQNSISNDKNTAYGQRKKYRSSKKPVLTVLSRYNPIDDRYRHQLQRHKQVRAEPLTVCEVSHHRRDQLSSRNSQQQQRCADDVTETCDAVFSLSDDDSLLSSSSSEELRLVTMCRVDPIVEKCEESISRYYAADDDANASSNNAQSRYFAAKPRDDASYHQYSVADVNSAAAHKPRGRYDAYEPRTNRKPQNEPKRKSNCFAANSTILSQINSYRTRSDPEKKMSRYCAFEQCSRNMSKY